MGMDSWVKWVFIGVTGIVVLSLIGGILQAWQDPTPVIMDFKTSLRGWMPEYLQPMIGAIAVLAPALVYFLLIYVLFLEFGIFKNVEIGDKPEIIGGLALALGLVGGFYQPAAAVGIYIITHGLALILLFLIGGIVLKAFGGGWGMGLGGIKNAHKEWKAFQKYLKKSEGLDMGVDEAINRIIEDAIKHMKKLDEALKKGEEPPETDINALREEYLQILNKIPGEVEAFWNTIGTISQTILSNDPILRVVLNAGYEADYKEIEAFGKFLGQIERDIEKLRKEKEKMMNKKNKLENSIARDINLSRNYRETIANRLSQIMQKEQQLRGKLQSIDALLARVEDPQKRAELEKNKTILSAEWQKYKDQAEKLNKLANLNEEPILQVYARAVYVVKAVNTLEEKILELIESYLHHLKRLHDTWAREEKSEEKGKDRKVLRNIVKYTKARHAMLDNLRNKIVELENEKKRLINEARRAHMVDLEKMVGGLVNVEIQEGGNAVQLALAVPTIDPNTGEFAIIQQASLYNLPLPPANTPSHTTTATA